jgi:hypothetical protein
VLTANNTNTDLANDLLHCKEWDHKTLCSPHVSKPSLPSYLHDDIPFTQAKEQDVYIPFNPYGKIVDFIDDIIDLIPDLEKNKEKGAAVILLTIHTLCRHLDTNEPILWEDCLSLDTSAEEGMPIRSLKMFLADAAW